MCRNTMICKLNIKPPVTICLQTCSEYSESATSILIEKRNSKHWSKHGPFLYSQRSIIHNNERSCDIKKTILIPKLILRRVLVLMLGCEKHWHPLKHRTDKVRTPTPFPLLLKGKTRIIYYFLKSFKYNWSLILGHSSSGEGNRKEGC